jgi:hypothetical protein
MYTSNYLCAYLLGVTRNHNCVPTNTPRLIYYSLLLAVLHEVPSRGVLGIFASRPGYSGDNFT